LIKVINKERLGQKMTNTNNEEFVTELLVTIRNAQQERYNEKHEAVLNAHPWIMAKINAYKNSQKEGNE
jgi:hypothetical protein